MPQKTLQNCLQFATTNIIFDLQAKYQRSLEYKEPIKSLQKIQLVA